MFDFKEFTIKYPIYMNQGIIFMQLHLPTLKFMGNKSFKSLLIWTFVKAIKFIYTHVVFEFFLFYLSQMIVALNITQPLNSDLTAHRPSDSLYHQVK